MKSTFDVLMARLRMKQLQLLITLDERKSLHKASSVMNMTQSAASKALGEVETMFGEPLFDRTKSGLVANQFGRCVIRYARLLATDLTSLCREVAEIRSGTGGRLAIGAIMGAIPDLLVPALEALHRRFPALSIEIVEDTSVHMLSLLDDGRLDLVIGRSAVSNDPAQYDYRALGEEPLVVVVGHAHPPFDEAELSLTQLASYRWVTYPSNMPMQAFLQREMDLAGMQTPRSTIATASTLVTLALLENSADMAAIVPQSVAALFCAKAMLRVVPVKFRSHSQTFGIVTRKIGVLSSMAQAFIEEVESLPTLHLPLSHLSP